MDEFKHKIKHEFALVGAQELLSSMNELCFNKCIFKPSSELDYSQKDCLSSCTSKFILSREVELKSSNARVGILN
ncbi:hypothetical protein BB561_005847 [Smittium simulii]|uniref:Mitochondrial import inner membrane translocase subunit n=1 Tax=Smittium simulii TaxID=133385 RepID=A0A2T9Y7Y2_9FUNG|nr:hypothetical protein BB561_005847 [Smittium simulii]